MSALDILLASPARNVQARPEEKEVELRRLSTEMGQPVIFRVRALTYNQVAELRGSTDPDPSICLAGIISPDLGDLRLAYHFEVLKEGEQWGDHGVGRGDLLKAMLNAGEINELAFHVQQLSGYKKQTVFEVKKN